MKILLAALAVTFAIAVTASVFAVWPVVADAPWEDERTVVRYAVELKESPVWLDHVQAWSTFATVIVATVGLLGIYRTVQISRDEQRVQWQPYLRVDVAPTTGKHEDFTPPPAYHSNPDLVNDLQDDLSWEKKVSFSAWVRNYQTNPLGTALAVSIFAIIEYEEPPGPDEDEPTLGAQYNRVRTPYCEVNKPVSIELFRIPRDWQATVWIVNTTFYDIRDNRHSHVYREAGTDAEHGRLACTYRNGIFVSTPEARPRGPKVSFD